MFYDKVINLCKGKGISPTKLMIDLKMGRSTVRGWKEGATPQNRIVLKVAEYFNVPANYLTSEEFTELPEEEPKGEYIYLDPKMKGQGIPPEILKRITDFFAK